MTPHPEFPVSDEQGNATSENLFTNCQNKIKSNSSERRANWLPH